MQRLGLAVVVLASAVSVALAQSQQQQQHAQQQHIGYSAGDSLRIQCLDQSGQWGGGPICRESQRELDFVYGSEQFFNCIIDVSPPMYEFFKQVVAGNQTWSCRVPVHRNPPPQDSVVAYLPFILPLWGFAQQSQGTNNLVINTHMNFIFHVDQGIIIGAAAYPVRDRFIILNENGGVLMLHGPTKFFSRGSFLSAYPSGSVVVPKNEQQQQQHTQPPHKAHQEKQQAMPSSAEQQQRDLIRNARSSGKGEQSADSTSTKGFSRSEALMGFLLFLVVALGALAISFLVYQRVLKPNLVRDHLKKE